MSIENKQENVLTSEGKYLLEELHFKKLYEKTCSKRGWRKSQFITIISHHTCCYFFSFVF